MKIKCQYQIIQNLDYYTRGKCINSIGKTKGDEYKLEDFTRREYATYLVAKDVEISPLKITTHFDKMDYMPVYPVYSWVPVKNADHYKIDVFYVPKYDFNNIEKNSIIYLPTRHGLL